MTEAENSIIQAGHNADTWLQMAVNAIDEQFGNGYAKEHPELVAGFMQAAALDQAGTPLRKITELIERSIGLDE